MEKKTIDDLSIDRLNLELEAERQADLMRHYGEMLTKAKSATITAKTALEIAEFECAEKMRRNPDKYGISKDTDTVIFKAVKTLPEWKQSQNMYLIAKRHEENCSVKIDIIRQRGQMIRILADLWLNNYYSTPIVKAKKLKRNQLKINNGY